MTHAAKEDMAISRRRFIQTATAAAALSLSGCNRSIKQTIATSAESRFKSNFDGTLIARSDQHYEAWRTGSLWQMHVPNRHPDLIARPRSDKAISAVLEYASGNGLQISCKSGGHNVAASFMRNSGVMLDLGEFNEIGMIDGSGKIWVGPSVWSWHLAQIIEPQGYTFPYCHCATVSMGGYLLGGGVGVNGDALGGIACHSVTALKIMIPDGTIVTADKNNNTDLFWLARGAGTGFFGVILAFQLQLYPRSNEILEQVYLYPLEASKAVGQWLEKIAEVCPKNIELLSLMAHRPPPLVGKTPTEQKMNVARLAAFGTQANDPASTMASIANIKPPEGALFVSPPTTLDIQQVLVASIDPRVGMGFGRYNVDTIWTEDLGTALESLVPTFLEAPSPKTHILGSPRHGATILEDASFSSLGSSFVGIYSIWDNADQDANNVSWTHAAAAKIASHSVGRYINETDGFRFPEKIVDCYSKPSFERIAQMRTVYDQNHLFHGFPA